MRAWRFTDEPKLSKISLDSFILLLRIISLIDKVSLSNIIELILLLNRI